MFKLLLKTQFIRIFHSIFKNQAKNWIRIFGGVGLGVLFLSGIYSLVFFALKHFYYVPILGPILIGKLLSLIFLTFFSKNRISLLGIAPTFKEKNWINYPAHSKAQNCC